MPQFDVIAQPAVFAPLTHGPRVFATPMAGEPTTPEYRRRADYAAWYAAGHEAALEGRPPVRASLSEDQPAADAGYQAGLACLVKRQPDEATA